MFYLVLLCMLLQSLYIFPIYHPLVLVSLLYVNDLLYLSVWKLFFTLLLVIPYQCTSLCLYHRYFYTNRFLHHDSCNLYLHGHMCLLPRRSCMVGFHASKHHKHCGSKIHIPLVSYSFLGWLFVKRPSPKIMSKIFKIPELVCLDRFSYIPSIFVFLFLQHTINLDTALSLYVYPCILNSFITLYFNVCFHSLKERDKCLSIDADIHMKFILKLIYRGNLQYVLYILTKFNGEHLHKTHHKHPTQIKRGEYDLAYYFIIVPLLRMNLIHDKDKHG